MPSSRLWELLARKYNHELAADEQAELDQLLRQHRDVFELNETFSRLRDLEVQKLSTAADEEKSRQSIAARIAATPEDPELQDPYTPVEIPTHTRRPKKFFLWTSVACTLILGAVWFYQMKSKDLSIVRKQNEIATSTSKSKVKLPDGSTVILNRNSKLVYTKDFGVTKREINLTGEAFFDIAKNEAIPLTVVAGTVKIRVMGTAFNVRAYTEDSSIETSLIRGSIEISSTDDPDRTIRMRPNEKVIFGKDISPPPSSGDGDTNIIRPRKPVQTFVLMNKIKPNPIDSTINEIVWVQDKLVFSKEPFYSVAQKMERWFQVKIRFKDKISELPVTGSLEKENLTEALDALQQLTPFNYQIDSGTVTISRNKTD